MQSARLFMYVMSFPVKKRVVNPHSASCNFSPRAESHLLEICAGAALGAVRATCAVLHDLLDELAMGSATPSREDLAAGSVTARQLKENKCGICSF